MMFYLIFLSLMACKKTPSVDCNSPTNDLSLCKELIIGKWEWVRTVTQIDTSATFTPKSLGHTVQFNFNSNGIVESFLDGQFRDTSSYEFYDGSKYSKLDSGKTYLRMKGCTYNGLISFYTYSRDVRVKVCDDSLYLPYEALIYHTGNDFYSKVK